MPLITDPDDLTQGATTAVSDGAWGAPTGNQVTITSSGAGLPTLADDEFFEVRGHSSPENNGLYRVNDASPSASSVTVDKLTGSDPVSAGAEAVDILGNSSTSANEKNIHYDTEGRGIYLLEQGPLSADGAILQAIYSNAKEDWKNDDALNPFPFPLVSVTPEQFEFIDDWIPVDDATESIRTRKLIRTGGWSEITAADVLDAQYAGVVTLGTFEDAANDTAYYQLGDDPTDTGAATDFDFAGPVNEGILVYAVTETVGQASGIDFVDGGGGNDQIVDLDGNDLTTLGYRIGGQVEVGDATTSANDGTFTILAITTTTNPNDTLEVATGTLTADTGDTAAVLAADNRNALKVFLRVRDADPNGKTFDQSDLAAIGQTSVDNKIFRFPLGNSTDQKISETDANIGSNSPYTEIEIRYFDAAFNREVDSTTKRDFGIVIDVGTHSGVDGVSNGTTTFSTAEGGIPASTYDGGTLVIHEGADQGSHSISSASGTSVTLDSALTGSESNLSFSLQRATPVDATAEEIYEKVQYELRQAADIDDTSAVVTGKTADELLEFVGDTLKAGVSVPTNPNGGGSGVIIEGFSANDTNRLTFVDNTETERTFPFVAAGTISWNPNLENDPDGWYVMFYTYTERFTNTGFGLSGSSGNTATLDSATTDLTAELADNDYIRLSGFTTEENNGIFRCTAAPTGTGPWSVTVEKVNGETLADEAAGASVSLDKNPIDSPDALIVDNNSGSDIRGSTSGTSSASFDYDYDGNTQGGRTAGSDAAVTIRFGGFSTAQNNDITGTITRATGLVFSLVAALERNYSNP